MVGAVQVVTKNVLCGWQLVGPVGKQVRGFFQAVSVVPTGPYLESPHGGAQTRLVEDFHYLGLFRDLGIVCVDVVTVPVSVQEISVRLAVGANAGSDGRGPLEHAGTTLTA